MKRPPVETQMYSFATVTFILILLIIISSQVMGQGYTPELANGRLSNSEDQNDGNPLRGASSEAFEVETLILTPITVSPKAAETSGPATALLSGLDSAPQTVSAAGMDSKTDTEKTADVKESAGSTPLTNGSLPTLNLDEAILPVAYEQTSGPQSLPEAPQGFGTGSAPLPPSMSSGSEMVRSTAAGGASTTSGLSVPTPATVPDEIAIPGLEPQESALDSAVTRTVDSTSKKTVPAEQYAAPASDVNAIKTLNPCPAPASAPVPVTDSVIPGLRQSDITKSNANPESEQRSVRMDGNPQDWVEEISRQVHDEVASQASSFAWKKGDVEISPYGILWASMSFENHPSVIGSTNFFLQPRGNTGNQCHIDYRGTILGFNIKGPKINLFPNAKMGGKVEFDLQRTIDFENKATVHLRHCYWEAQSDEWRVLAGQTWDVVSPLRCGTLMYDAGWMDGNVGYRRAQFRLERYCNVSPCAQWVWQGCLSAPFGGDSGSLLNYDRSAFRVKAGTYPIIQSRIAYVWGDRKGKEKPIELGLAGHIGEMQYGALGGVDENKTEKTWGLYLDAYVPLTSRFGVQGELFKGENLAMFLGGIGQGVFKNAEGDAQAIDAQGGWINLWYDLTDKLQYRVGYMIDDPTNDFDNITTSVKTLNHSIFTSIMYSASKNLRFGLEYNHIQTTYAGADAGTSKGDRLDFVTMYFF